MTIEIEPVRILSGNPSFRRWMVQRVLNRCALWPLAFESSVRELTWMCTCLGVQLVADDEGVWIEPIKL